MKRTTFLLLVFITFFVFLPAVTATDIRSENVTVHLQESGGAQVSAVVDVASLTAERFSYFMPYTVNGFTASLQGTELDCDQDEHSAGSRFLCTVPRYQNLSIHISYTTNELVTRQPRGRSQFQYTHNILEPTKVYRLELVLPEGFGLAVNESASTDPEPVTVGSTGRQISVQWVDQVSLGDQAQFTATIEQLQETSFLSDRFRLMIVGLTAVLLLAVVVLIVLQRRSNMDSGKEAVVMQVLQEDEQRVLQFIADQGGECKQKAVVDGLPYSKAKVSTVLSDLADRGIIEKQKEGRTNTVTLRREIKRE